MDAEVVARLRRRYGEQVIRERIMAAALRETEERTRQAEAALAQVRAALGAQDGQLAELRREYIDWRIILEEYRDFKAHVEREWGALKEQEQRLLDTPGGLRDARKAGEELERTATQLDAWDDLTAEQKKALLAEFISRVTARRLRGGEETRVEIFWRHRA